MANPSVTAGFRKASLLPHAIEANTPAITASPHPVVITIQPDASPFDRFRSTQATTPLPRRIRINVPTNSPKKGVVIFFSVETCYCRVRQGAYAPALSPRSSTQPKDRVTAFFHSE